MEAVMYHYVRPGPVAPPYEYYYLDLDDFRSQLDHLDESYDLISRDQFLNCVRGERRPPEDAVILTFDDGLIDHYEHVLPELQARNLWGLFFIPGPLGEEALAAHRVHTLLGTKQAEEIAEALEDQIDADDVRKGQNEAFDQMYRDTSSEAAVTKVKRTLNYLLPYERVSTVLDALEDRFPEVAVDTEELYMSSKQIRSLVEAGMLVGGHTVTHRVLARLSSAEQQSEIRESLAYVDEVAGEQSLRSFAYPYGTAETFDDTTLAALRGVGCDIAFTTEEGEITTDVLSERPLQLARYDCNEYPYGESSRY